MSFLDRLWNGMNRQISFSMTWPLGTGYTKPMNNLAVLMDALCEAYDKVWLDAKPFAPKDGETFCNEAVQYVAAKFSYTRFAGKMANEIIDILNNDKRWAKVSANEAGQAASAGRLVIAALKNEPHGHVCIVRPGTLETSGRFKENAPKVMNIGKDCFISKGANYAFREKPDYFSLES